MTQQFVCEVVEDPENPGELLLDLGTEVCAAMGWSVGDTLEWKDNKDGSWTISKKMTQSA